MLYKWTSHHLINIVKNLCVLKIHHTCHTFMIWEISLFVRCVITGYWWLRRYRRIAIWDTHTHHDISASPSYNSNQNNVRMNDVVHRWWLWTRFPHWAYEAILKGYACALRCGVCPIGHSPMGAFYSTCRAWVGPECFNDLFMITPSNGNIFRVIGPLCGEFTSQRWIPRTKASEAEFDGFFYPRLNKRLVIWDATALIMTSL